MSHNQKPYYMTGQGESQGESQLLYPNDKWWHGHLTNQGNSQVSHGREIPIKGGKAL